MAKDFFFSYSLLNRKKKIKSILLFENENIIGLINNPVDYVIDGILFINRKKIKLIKSERDALREKVILTKYENYIKSDTRYVIPDFVNFKDLFLYIKQKNIFCELSLTKEDIVYIGNIVDVNNECIDIDFYDSKFKLLDKAYVYFEDITTVTILSDYINTVELFSKNRR